MSSSCQKGYVRVNCYENKSDDWVTSLYGMAVVAIVTFIIFSPLMFRITNAVFGGYLATNTSMWGASPNWLGWLLHVIVAAGVGYGVTLGFMQLFKPTPYSSKCDRTPVNSTATK